MEREKWISTEELLAELRRHPDKILMYEHRLGAWLSSEHWLVYLSKRDLFCDSTAVEEWERFTEAQFLYIHSGEFWRIVV